MLFDTHTHLQWDLEKDPLEKRLMRARQAHVLKMVCVGIDIPSSRQAAAIAAKSDGVCASAGIHPNHVINDRSELDKELLQISDMLSSGEHVAVGESGLDFYRDNSTPEDQEYSFHRHLEFSRTHNLPIIIHCREALNDCLNCIKEYNNSVAGVMHCWPGTAEDVDGFIEAGMHISFAGNLTYKNNQHLRDAAKRVPLNRLLIETDAPFLSPQPKRGKRNEPAFVQFTLQCLCEIRNESEAEITTACWENACKLFQA